MKKMLKTFLIVILVSLSAFGLSSCSNTEATPGKSAYELAVENGFVGSITEWLESLNGSNGDSITIEDIYSSAVNNGFEGSFLEFLDEYLGDSDYNESYRAVNKSLLSAVSIYSTFTKTVTTGGGFFGKPVTKEESYISAGSGIIYSLDKENGDAYIITNHHVVYDVDSNTADKISDDIKLYLYGQEYEAASISATYLGSTMLNDIAVLKVEDSPILKNSNALEATVGNSNAVIVGQKNYAIGNPSGYGISASEGIISVDSEYIEMTAPDNVTPMNIRVIRVDTAINPGNSGGGLFNEQGELIGIVNAKSISENVDNIGYALPTSLVIPLVNNIIANCNGESQVNPLVCKLGITVTKNSSNSQYDATSGIVKIIEEISIVEVSQTGDAHNKLLAEDIIKSIVINGITYEIDRMHILSEAIYTCSSGDTVTLNILRGGVNVTVDVTFTTSTNLA